MIYDMRKYEIEVRGYVDQMDINTMSPVKIDLVQPGECRTYLMANTDQSGLIGLLRYLHGMGLVILSVHETEKPSQMITP